MAKKPKNAISPTRSENYPEWYQQVVRAADLAETSPVRGCMVIKPWGYGIWENIQKHLDRLFKDTGHVNAYFPLFIPKSFLEKEAEHVEGFAKECAVVTHHRLEDDGKGGLKPAGELDEPLVVRPTSETIIGASFAKWVESYRDLPLLINQWANVVRWEMRTRLFLRTTEFLWQEGHTAHATEQEAVEETERMLGVYADFAENYLAMPVLTGRKPAHERFPGAVETLCIEALMQDNKALQAGTSHFLGQNFAKAQEIQYLGEDGKRHHCWTTSWGVSTRLIGGLIMTHADDDGMVLPPRVAPTQVIIQPIVFKADDPQAIYDYCEQIAAEIKKKSAFDERITVFVDKRDLHGGEKSWQWIKKGAPVRVEVGPRDMAAGSVFVGRRDKGLKEKESIDREAFIEGIGQMLEDVQTQLLAKAKAFQENQTHYVESEEAFNEFFTGEGGFAVTHWNGDIAIAERIQQTMQVTLRCLPFEDSPLHGGPGACPFTGEPSKQRVVWAKSY